VGLLEKALVLSCTDLQKQSGDSFYCKRKRSFTYECRSLSAPAFS